jgi:hypothetical protein
LGTQLFNFHLDNGKFIHAKIVTEFSALVNETIKTLFSLQVLRLVANKEQKAKLKLDAQILEVQLGTRAAQAQ